jgi:hypothetical protein
MHVDHVLSGAVDAQRDLAVPVGEEEIGAGGAW